MGPGVQIEDLGGERGWRAIARRAGVKGEGQAEAARVPRTDPLSSPLLSSLLSSTNGNPASSHKRGKKDLGKENRGLLKYVNTFIWCLQHLKRQVLSLLPKDPKDRETEAQRDFSVSQITQL